MIPLVFRSFVMVAGLTAFLGVANIDSSRSTVSVDFVAPAYADIPAVASYGILKCFHPSGVFISGSLGPEVIDANGRNAAYGRIDFRGGLSGNSYWMTYVVHVKVQDKDTMVRITPLLDNAPFVPNPDCFLREWTRVN